jgi:hypothetical protein
LISQLKCGAIFSSFFGFYRVNFSEASVWRCFGLDPYDSFHLGYVFQIHFFITKELLKDITGGFKVL